ncbi:MAG: hypothetical protein IJB01_04270, partial [Bacteroidaceae bacterium]|nr:hypothetical protein [Bacteroidaceae bacterium]
QHSFGEINLPSSQTTLLSRRHCKKIKASFVCFCSFIVTFTFGAANVCTRCKKIKASFVCFCSFIVTFARGCVFFDGIYGLQDYFRGCLRIG